MPEGTRWERFVAWCKGNWKWLLIVPAILAALAGGFALLRRILAPPSDAVRKAGVEEGKVIALKDEARREGLEADADMKEADKAGAEALTHEERMAKIEAEISERLAKEVREATRTKDHDAENVAENFRRLPR